MAHEQTITVEMDGMFFNIPTVIDGKKVKNEVAIRLLRERKLKPFSVHMNFDDAINAAKSRSDRAREKEKK